ncbi:hypothetical protein BO71DRAFT_216429 [Aspergillus ellipticus CBS 707.79]|uniref:Uncharacterized protein n=1 Tax=Aspergillus ellipticus CBS 707.79 TaxID=1448320 RepID=A0A319DCF8_9EURO|nr:hypothetical protein BO71DRAFT_216429 [Aspergillus ellipticus CBS 707.79]
MEDMGWSVGALGCLLVMLYVGAFVVVCTLKGGSRYDWGWCNCYVYYVRCCGARENTSVWTSCRGSIQQEIRHNAIK